MKRLTIGQHVVSWVASRTNEFGNFGASQGIGLQQWNGECWKLIAGVVYSDYNGVNINMHVASEGPYWLNKAYLWVCFDYPFNQCKVKRVTALIGEGNTKSIRFTEHLGFELEARLKDAHPTGDLMIFAMRQPQAERWLNLKVAHENIHSNRMAVAA